MFHETFRPIKNTSLTTRLHGHRRTCTIARLVNSKQICTNVNAQISSMTSNACVLYMANCIRSLFLDQDADNIEEFETAGPTLSSECTKCKDS